MQGRGDDGPVDRRFLPRPRAPAPVAGRPQELAPPGPDPRRSRARRLTRQRDHGPGGQLPWPHAHLGHCHREARERGPRRRDVGRHRCRRQGADGHRPGHDRARGGPRGAGGDSRGVRLDLRHRLGTRPGRARDAVLGRLRLGGRGDAAGNPRVPLPRGGGAGRPLLAIARPGRPRRPLRPAKLRPLRRGAAGGAPVGRLPADPGRRPVDRRDRLRHRAQAEVRRASPGNPPEHRSDPLHPIGTGPPPGRGRAVQAGTGAQGQPAHEGGAVRRAGRPDRRGRGQGGRRHGPARPGARGPGSSPRAPAI